MNNSITKTQTLLDIDADGVALDELISEYAAENDGDLTGIAPIIDQWLEENATALEIKLNGYAAVIREYEARATARKTEAARRGAGTTGFEPSQQHARSAEALLRESRHHQNRNQHCQILAG